MSFRRLKKPYGKYQSWISWRSENSDFLVASGIPPIAYENESNWSFFLQEADPTLMGGVQFEFSDLTRDQLAALGILLEQIPEEASGGDLLESFIRRMAALTNK